MTEEQLQEKAFHGEEIMAWTVDEYERHERGPIWYAVAVVLGVTLLLYAVLTQNFLFAVIVIMFGVIIGLSTMREPQQLLFVMTSRGVEIGGKFIPFKEFRSFWVLYEPPHVKNVYLEYKRSVRPHIVVPLYDQNPLEVRKALLKYLDEDLTQEEEPLADLLGRLLKL
jgi:hypothetical protein